MRLIEIGHTEEGHWELDILEGAHGGDEVEGLEHEPDLGQPHLGLAKGRGRGGGRAEGEEN